MTYDSATFEGKHDKSVLDRTRSEVSGALKRLCVRLLTGPRGGATDVDAASAGMIAIYFIFHINMHT